MFDLSFLVMISSTFSHKTVSDKKRARVSSSQEKQGSSEIPRFVPGRRGGTSVVDAVVRALWNAKRPKDGDEWPAKTFNALVVEASSIVGYQVTSSTVRSAIYGHMELFEKDEEGGGLKWRLSKKARTA
jgi:hypothetical protein